jgi:hypothetical protein
MWAVVIGGGACIAYRFGSAADGSGTQPPAAVGSSGGVVSATAPIQPEGLTTYTFAVPCEIVNLFGQTQVTIIADTEGGAVGAASPFSPHSPLSPHFALLVLTLTPLSPHSHPFESSLSPL